MSTTHATQDPEVEALNTIIATLERLTEQQRHNVLLYVNARYPGRGKTQGGPGQGQVANSATTTQFADLGDLFDKANPQSQADRVLVVAYWKQAIEGAESFEAFPVSKELKHLGHGVANITSALDSLMRQSPKLVMQVAKSGKSQQARKRYKVTREGLRRVEAIVGAHVEGEGNGS
jgi:hypothetical protein